MQERLVKKRMRWVKSDSDRNKRSAKFLRGLCCIFAADIKLRPAHKNGAKFVRFMHLI